MNVSAAPGSPRQSRIFQCLPMILLLALPHAASQSTDPEQPLRVGTIEIQKLVRYDTEWFIRASRVAPHQVITLKELQAAAQRLSRTGLFKRVGDRYMITGSRIDIIWLVEEIEWGAEIILDNFVWFTDDELREAIAREIPSYDGTAPGTEGVVATITKSLQDLLVSRNIKGTVDHTSAVGSDPGAGVLVFSVGGIRIPVCGVEFSGGSVVTDAELSRAAATLVGTNFSRDHLSAFTHANVLSLYRRRGYLAADFGKPRVTPYSDSACKDGVKASFAVREGEQYRLEELVFEGNAVLPSQQLDMYLSFKPGDLADMEKLSEELRGIRDAYGRLGYVHAGVGVEKKLDSERRTAKWTVEIKEGSQFHMGKLIIKGLTEAQKRKVTERWRLAPGSLFDDTYSGRFVEEVQRSDPRSMARAGIGYQYHEDTLTVDVTLTFEP